MKSQDSRVKELAAILSGDDPLVISEYISSLRNNEAFKGAIDILAEYYDQTSDRHAMRVVEEFFNDIKNPDLQPEILDALSKPYGTATISMIVASCWQSGMDYSEHLDFFTQLFLTGDYSVSIECMTLIAENAESYSSEKKSEVITQLENSLATIQAEKINLSKELVLALKEI